MDELKTNKLPSYFQTLLASLSTDKIKTILFIGINAMKNEMEYNELMAMNICINELIEKQQQSDKKKKQSNNSQLSSSAILKVTKGASLSATLPSDIIGKNICQYLIMTNITQLARCDRKMAIICHSPIAIRNVMHRLDAYAPYGPTADGTLIDGGYNWHTLNQHRVQNVEKAAIPLKILNDLNKLNSFRRVKHLTFFDRNIEFSDWAETYHDIIPMPFLETIGFINTYNFTNILSFLDEYRNKTKEDSKSKKSCKKKKKVNKPYWNPIIGQIRSIAFLGCSFDALQDYQFYEEDDDEKGKGLFKKYSNMIEFIVPRQPNNLQILKFQNSYFTKTDECKQANDAFADVKRIKSSLCNLKVIIYSGLAYNAFSRNDGANLWYSLTEIILRNLSFFKEIRGIHLHEPHHRLGPLCFNKANMETLANIVEVCVHINLDRDRFKCYVGEIHLFVPKLEKLCLVIKVERISEKTLPAWNDLMHSILCNNKNLRLLQIVCLMKTNCTETMYCIERIQVLNKMGMTTIKSLQSIKEDCPNRYNEMIKQPLLFKIHVKSCHLETKHKCSMLLPSNQQIALNFVNILKQLISEYLVSFPLGKIQFKWTSNLEKHTIIMSKLKHCVTGLKELSEALKLRVDITDYYKVYPRYLHDIDRLKVFSFSVSKMDLAEHNVHHHNKWIADCKWCCNTSWI